MRYPFNTHGFHDLVFEIKQFFWWIKLYFNIENKFIKFDVSESIVDILFAQFSMFYEKYGSAFYPIEKNLEPYNDGNMYLNDKARKKALNKMREDYETINNINSYISKNRKENRKQLEMLYDLIYKEADSGFEFHPETGYYIFGYKHEPNWNKIKCIFDKSGRMTTTYEKSSKKDCNFFDIETVLYNTDTLFAKKILEVREYLWD